MSDAATVDLQLFPLKLASAKYDQAAHLAHIQSIEQSTVVPRVETYGGLSVVIFDFPQVGDYLRPHVHGEADAHITVVARGSVEVVGGASSYTAYDGDILHFPAGVMHGFRAVSPARIVNIVT